MEHEPIGILFDETLITKAARIIAARRDHWEEQGEWQWAGAYESAFNILKAAIDNNVELLNQYDRY